MCDWVNMTYSRKVRLPFILFCFLRLRHGRYRLFLYWHLVAAALLCAPQFCLFSTSCVVFFPFAFCCKCCTHCDLGKKQTNNQTVNRCISYTAGGLNDFWIRLWACQQSLMSRCTVGAKDKEVAVWSHCLNLKHEVSGSAVQNLPRAGWCQVQLRVLQRKAGFNKPGCGLHWDSLGHMLANSFTSCVCSFVFRQFYKGETNMSLLSIICCSHLPNMMTIILWYICNIFMYFSLILLFLLQLL